MAFSAETSKTVSLNLWKAAGAIEAAYMACTSHQVILLLKHLITGLNLLSLSVSRCAQSSLGVQTRLPLIYCQGAKCQHAAKAQHRPLVPLFNTRLHWHKEKNLCHQPMRGTAGPSSCHRRPLSACRSASTLHLLSAPHHRLCQPGSRHIPCCYIPVCRNTRASWRTVVLFIGNSYIRLTLFKS